MSDSKAITDYLRRYNAWRRGEDSRTMYEAGLVPEELGKIIVAAVGVLEQAPDMSRIALRKIEQMGGTPCGVLVRNADGALAAVSDMGRVTWLDDCVTQGDCKGECVLPGKGAEPVGEVCFDLGPPSVIYAELYSESLPSLAPGTKIYTSPQPAQQGSVPEAATEEMIEEGVTALIRGLKAFVGNYTQIVSNIWEDMRAAFIPRPEGDGWIKCIERLPTEADADWDDNVIVFDSEGDMAVTHYGVVEQCGQPGGSITHWMPTGLKRPQPPQEVSVNE